MFKKILAILFVAFTTGTLSFAQLGALKGKVIDEGNGEAISFANVQLEINGSAIAKTIADIDGNFTIKAITPGKYDLKSAAVGYQTLTIRGMIISGDKTAYQDMKVKSSAKEIETFVLTDYKEPLQDPNTTTGGTVTREEFQAMPSKNINSVASTTAGVFQQDEGGALFIKGSRSQGTDYYIDGEKVRGTYGLPQSSIEQISVITGGVPAQYGDATGGFINITTRGGIRPDYFGGVELVSSQLTDAYGYNFGGFNVGGPLFIKKDSTGNKNAKIGFFLSGEVSSEKDPYPSAIGVYKVKDEKLKELEEKPLYVNPKGEGNLLNSELLEMNDLEHIKARQNVRSNIARLAGKIDFKPSNNITFTLGGSMDYGNYHGFVWEYALLNPSNNPQTIYNTMRMYGKIMHKIGKQQKSKDDKTTSLINNAYYTLQVGYTKYQATTQDDTHKDNFFDYGYVGKFNKYRVPGFKLMSDKIAPIDSTYYVQSTWVDTAITFSAGNQNPLGANYTEQYYDFLSPSRPYSTTQIQQGHGMLNGDRPYDVFRIWYNTGRQYNGYSNADQSQIRITGNFSADIKNHAIQAGFEFEKRDDRSWAMNPIGLWTSMRSLANRHIAQLDKSDSSLYAGPIYTGSIITNPAYPVYVFKPLVNAALQSQFDKSIRKQLHIANDVWIDIDSYDPSIFNISMFSPDELGSAYYGYSYDGKKLSGKQSLNLASLEKYYKEKDANDNYTRIVPSYQPIYMAGYLQDKFDIKDMKFNIGLRVDNFNTNQPVLKDKYLSHEAYTVKESIKFNHPSNVGSDFVVYVNNARNPLTVVGYRDGDQWYNSKGIQISDPALLMQGTTIQPYLKYPNESKTRLLDSSDVHNVFKMYDVQTTFMPRIAFTFPISDLANFFAHYDVLSQRPPNRLGSIYSRPSLKAERTIDYEVGFRQTLNEKKNSALSLSAFYREMRDMLQEINVYGAYPETYITYGNIDFGTAKGFTMAYDLRRTDNVQLTASYTLQFAEGTGSAVGTAHNIINEGQPNLRTTMPLDFDQRHAIVLNADYRFGKGKDYRGPSGSLIKTLLENLGGNIVFRAGSGLPYSRQQNLTSGNGNGGDQVVFGQNARTSLKGKINGSNLPWQNRIDLRIDKNIELKWGGEGDKAKSSNLNVYLQVLNVLNTKNVLNLYRYTGDPNDDGYLSAPESQNQINGYASPQSFEDLYTIKMANPSFYSIPRRIRIGVILDF
ncbi:MAG: carboxypeptidase-like regulatory domain-containing protein [Bacteroidota bacterium]